MNLYDRDYNFLTPDEESAWLSLQEIETVKTVGRFVPAKSCFRDYPKAARHFESLFPNNYLDVVDLKDEARLKQQADGFQHMLDSPGVNERAILNHIKSNKAYFIVGSILKEHYSFGHHEACLFSEFRLGNSHIVDYLIAGKSSDGWSLVFVEFESPTENITLKNGDLGQAFRKGLSQISEWDQWIDGRFSSLSELFVRQMGQGKDLP